MYDLDLTFNCVINVHPNDIHNHITHRKINNRDYRVSKDAYSCNALLRQNNCHNNAIYLTCM